MEVYKFCPRGYFGSNTYVIISDNEAGVIDPSVDYYVAKGVIGNKRVKYIFVTHSHFDHILKLDNWVANTGAEVIIGEGDLAGLSNSTVNCYRLFLGEDNGYFGRATPVREGSVFSLGSSQVKVISTPGHTAGGVSYLAGKSLFSGDTVFAGGGYGRCDLPGADETALFASILKICELPPDVAVFAGHGESLYISEVRENFK